MASLKLNHYITETFSILFDSATANLVDPDTGADMGSIIQAGYARILEEAGAPTGIVKIDEEDYASLVLGRSFWDRSEPGVDKAASQEGVATHLPALCTVLGYLKSPESIPAESAKTAFYEWTWTKLTQSIESARRDECVAVYSDLCQPLAHNHAKGAAQEWIQAIVEDKRVPILELVFLAVQVRLAIGGEEEGGVEKEQGGRMFLPNGNIAIPNLTSLVESHLDLYRSDIIADSRESVKQNLDRFSQPSFDTFPFPQLADMFRRSVRTSGIAKLNLHRYITAFLYQDRDCIEVPDVFQQAYEPLLADSLDAIPLATWKTLILSDRKDLSLSDKEALRFSDPK